MGIVYVLHGRFGLPDFIRDAIDFVSGPTTFFAGATLGFIVMYTYRRTLANGLVAWGIVNAFLLFFGLSMTDYDFRDIVTKPDNVPIVGLIVLVGFFTWVGLRRAVINDSRMAQGLPNLEELEPEKTLTWPDLVYTELIAMVAQTIFLVVWAIALAGALEQPASSTTAPNPSKAPWYFLGLQEMLVYFDPWMAGVVLPSMIIVGLMAMPYIDTNKQGNGYYTIAQRKFAYITFQYGFLVLWVILILLGTFLRGPNWNFFGPYEYWDVHKLIPLNNVNLSDIFWVQLLGTSRPTNILIREAPGFVLVMAYFADHAADPGAASSGRYIAEAGLAPLHRAGRPAAVHGEPADQDGAPVDAEPEVPRRDPGILLQHLIGKAGGPARRGPDGPDDLRPPRETPTMPATEETYRSRTALHVVFAISSVAMTLSIVWMIMADHLRPWKEVQREFHHIEDAKLRAEEKKKADELNQQQLAAIDAKIEAASKQGEENAKQIRAKENELKKVVGGSSGSTRRSGSTRPSSTASGAYTT